MFFKLYNKITGLWYVKGLGFVGKGEEASLVDSQMKMAICYTFDNVVFITIHKY